MITWEAALYAAEGNQASERPEPRFFSSDFQNTVSGFSPPNLIQYISPNQSQYVLELSFEQHLRIIQLVVAIVNNPQQTTSICLLVAREGREEGEFIWVSLFFFRHL